MTDKTPQPSPFPPLEVPADIQATYVNLVRIAHTPSELTFDFALMLPGGEAPRVRSRVIMSPLGAKLFLRALTDNLSKYESSFGEIKVPGEKSLADFLFHPPQPPQDSP